MSLIANTSAFILLIFVCISLPDGSNAESSLWKKKSRRYETTTTPVPISQVVNSFAGDGNDNKVSKLLHLAHQKANEQFLTSTDGKKVAKNSVTKIKFRGKTDREILEQLCDRNPTTVCKATLKAALNLSDENIAKIVEFLRKLPPDVEADRVLYVALFGVTVKTIHTAQLDKSLNMAWDLVMSRNLYIYGMSKVFDMTLFAKDYMPNVYAWFQAAKNETQSSSKPH